MTDYTELKRLAEASLGEWYEFGELRCEDRSGYINGLHHDDEYFIAAANPAAVLALIAENDAVRKDLQNQRTDNAQLIYALKHEEQSYLALRTERDQLKAENEVLHEEVALDDKLIADRDRLLNMFECPAHGQCIPFAMGQVEALRKDAERYRFLANRTFFVDGLFRTPSPDPVDGSNLLKGSVSQHFEDAIDAAIVKGTEG